MQNDNTERLGVNAVEAIILKEFKWAFREQPVSDYGIDAIIEEMSGEKPTGKLIALQIKSGQSYFKKRRGSYVYNGEMRHLDYWTQHSLPVFIILHNPTDQTTVWQKVERSAARVHESGWSIDIPITNKLDKASKRFFERNIASDDASERRFYFATDSATMKSFAEKKAVYLKVYDWVNKSLNIRGVDIFFDDYNRKEPDFTLNYWAAGYSVHEFVRKRFPWLTYEYAEPIANHADEVEVHTLNVSLSEEADMFLRLEEFYKDGPTYDEPDAPESDDALTEEQELEHWMRRAMEKDPWD